MEKRPISDLNPRIMRVSASGSGQEQEYSSISEAANKASEGDQIVVGPGTYGPNEKFPIYIPPRCQLIGSGSNTCRIDGGNRKDIEDRPLNPYQSLVLLGDSTSISGFTIQKSGGNGLSSEQGARVLITKNVIRENAHHGLLVFGTNGALVNNNEFFKNGAAEREFGGPRPGIGRQGHHIYIEGRSGSTNEVNIIENKMDKVFADAIANDMYDQAEGLSMRLQILNNTISGCGRNGMSIVSSYDPSKTEVFVEIRNNFITETKVNAIDVVSSYSIVNRPIKGARLAANIFQNQIKGCKCGILAVGSYEASEDASARYNIIGNHIEDATDQAIRAVGGYNLNGWMVSGARVEAIIANNSIACSDLAAVPAMLIEGGVADARGTVTSNVVYVHIVGNEVLENGTKKISGQGLVIRDGPPTNQVRLLEGSTQPAGSPTD